MSYKVESKINVLDNVPTLSDRISEALANYFANLEGDLPANFYQLVLEQMEKPLLESILNHTGGNESKAAIFLGISRGTLRQRRRKYGHYDDDKKK